MLTGGERQHNKLCVRLPRGVVANIVRGPQSLQSLSMAKSTPIFLGTGDSQWLAGRSKLILSSQEHQQQQQPIQTCSDNNNNNKTHKNYGNHNNKDNHETSTKSISNNTCAGLNKQANQINNYNHGIDHDDDYDYDATAPLSDEITIDQARQQDLRPEWPTISNELDIGKLTSKSKTQSSAGQGQSSYATSARGPLILGKSTSSSYSSSILRHCWPDSLALSALNYLANIKTGEQQAIKRPNFSSSFSSSSSSRHSSSNSFENPSYPLAAGSLNKGKHQPSSDRADRADQLAHFSSDSQNLIDDCDSNVGNKSNWIKNQANTRKNFGAFFNSLSIRNRNRKRDKYKNDQDHSDELLEHHRENSINNNNNNFEQINYEYTNREYQEEEEEEEGNQYQEQRKDSQFARDISTKMVNRRSCNTEGYNKKKQKDYSNNKMGTNKIMSTTMNKKQHSSSAKLGSFVIGTFLVLSLLALCTVRLGAAQQLSQPHIHHHQQPQQQHQHQHQLQQANSPAQIRDQPSVRSHSSPQQLVPARLPVSQGSNLPIGPGAQRNVGPQPVAGSLVANVNCNKIRGHVTLMPLIQNGGVSVSSQITEGPPGEVYQWSIHQFPVKPGAAMCTCSPLILGSKLIDLGEIHGNLPSQQEFNIQSQSLSLFGPDSPVGHSLLLRGLKTGVVACSTFLPTSRKSNYRAKFHQPLSGSVTIFQTAFGSSFLSHLMYSNGTRRHSMHRFDLVKSDDDMLLLNPGNRPLVGSSPLTAPSSQSGSQSLIEQREYENEISQCQRFSNGEPLLRNISFQLSVSTENFGMRSRTALVLPQIPFETFSSVYVIIYSEHNPLDPIACAPLKFVKPKQAAAKFQTNSVQGNVIFSQDSPYDPTVARISLQLPNSDGHSYGIDELPMIIRRKSDTRVCPNIREIIFNPHHIEPSSVPAEGEATSDQYAVGDLSGKYGSLAGKSSERIQVNDYNLPLFGPNSIVGRAMTVYSADGIAIACSNVELTTPMITAFATFDFGIQGQFIFRQPQNDCNGDTYVYIEVSQPMNQPGGSQHSSSGGSHQIVNSIANQAQIHDNTRTLDHNWHVHVNPVDSGLDHLSTTECSAAGPHYNPYNTSTSSIYSRDCTPFNVLRCELGDLASKMFTLEIPPYRVKSGQEPDIGKFFGTDIDLPLCGPVSIVNRSIVVHGPDFGINRLACSTVIEFKPRSS